jgi:hypothetical protein
MNSNGKRARLGGVLVAVAAVLALVALPGLASGHRGHSDPAPAGTIQSFDEETGVLTIDLTDGGSVSGLVTRRTHIRCDNGRHRGRHGLRHHRRGHGASASRRGGSEAEDNHQQGGEEPGDDRGGQGLEPGDDRGGRGLKPGEDHHAGGNGSPGHGDHHGRCTTAALTEGATVKIAELVLVDGKAIYKAVVLPQPAPAEEEGEEETEEAPAGA